MLSQLIGIVALVGVLAVLVLLPRPEWPRAPRWMRTTAVVLALALVGVAIASAWWGAERRDNATLVAWLVAIGAGLTALKLLRWAWIGRINPRSLLLAAARPDARSRPRERSR